MDDKEKTEATEATEAAETPAEPPKEKPAEKKKKKKSDETDKLRQALEEQEDRYRRMLAEYANYKRRTEQEKESLGQFTRADVLKKLLPTVDNLERAAAAPDGADYRRGVEMTEHQLKEALTAMGLEAFGEVGDAFDPELHHAVMREDAENAETETVTEVFQKGYRLGERVLRPAMVKVAN